MNRASLITHRSDGTGGPDRGDRTATRGQRQHTDGERRGGTVLRHGDVARHRQRHGRRRGPVRHRAQCRERGHDGEGGVGKVDDAGDLGLAARRQEALRGDAVAVQWLQALQWIGGSAQVVSANGDGHRIIARERHWVCDGTWQSTTRSSARSETIGC